MGTAVHQEGCSAQSHLPLVFGYAWDLSLEPLGYSGDQYLQGRAMYLVVMCAGPEGEALCLSLTCPGP